MDYLRLSAGEIVKGIRSGEYSAVSYASALITQANRWKEINSFITFDSEKLLKDASQVDERIKKGDKIGPLAGLPLLIKDCINAVGYPATSGTPALSGYFPNNNAPALQRLLDAGAIVAGKTNLHELSYGITSNNFYTGAVRNPYDLKMIAGGSSGGTAAAIAARIGVVGLGTDTGGSIRIPAALCGVVGLRTTLGRWPVAGIAPVSHSRDVIGPLGRHVEDVALLDAVVTGEMLAKPITLKGVRIGIPRNPFWEHLDFQTEIVMENSLEALRKAGVVLVDVDIKEIAQLDNRYGFPLTLFESMLDLPSFLITTNSGVVYDELIEKIATPEVKKILEQTKSISLDEYITALHARAQMQFLYSSLWQSYNLAALIFPTTTLPAKPIGRDETVSLQGKQVPTFQTYTRNTSPGSIAGLPGLSVPVGLTKTGLPVGLEIDGPAWQDRWIVSLGMSIEKLFPALPSPILKV